MGEIRGGDNNRESYSWRGEGVLGDSGRERERERDREREREVERER